MAWKYKNTLVLISQVSFNQFIVFPGSIFSESNKIAWEIKLLFYYIQ